MQQSVQDRAIFRDRLRAASPGRLEMATLAHALAEPEPALPHPLPAAVARMLEPSFEMAHASPGVTSAPPAGLATAPPSLASEPPSLDPAPPSLASAVPGPGSAQPLASPGGSFLDFAREAPERVEGSTGERATTAPPREVRSTAPPPEVLSPAPPPAVPAGLSMVQVIDTTTRQLSMLKLKLSAITSVSRADEGWRVTAEMLERRSVPDTSDLLGVYELQLDHTGNLLRYERTHMRRRCDLG
jgi:hypothetical protein